MFHRLDTEVFLLFAALPLASIPASILFAFFDATKIMFFMDLSVSLKSSHSTMVDILEEKTQQPVVAGCVSQSLVDMEETRLLPWKFLERPKSSRCVQEEVMVV
jgi:hypothetical protein